MDEWQNGLVKSGPRVLKDAIWIYIVYIFSLLLLCWYDRMLVTDPSKIIIRNNVENWPSKRLALKDCDGK